MPNGRCHSAATVATTSVFLNLFCTGVVVKVTPTLVKISEYNEWAFWAALGAFSGLVVEPDLDQDYQAAPLGTMRETGGDGLARLWQVYWSLYAKLIPHRSLASHGPIIGTLGRVLYLLPVYSIPLFLWSHFFGFPAAQFFGYVVGLCWVDTLHFVMDFWIPRRFFPQNPYHK